MAPVCKPFCFCDGRHLISGLDICAAVDLECVRYYDFEFAIMIISCRICRMCSANRDT